MPLVWPAELPAPRQAGFSESLGDNRIISPVTKGRFKSRKQYSTRVDADTVTLVLTKAQVQTFKAFYGQLNDGVDTFTWDHPLEGSIEMQFGEGTPEIQHELGKHWTVSFKLLTVPT